MKINLELANSVLTTILPKDSQYMLLVRRDEGVQYITNCLTRQQLVDMQREIRDLIAVHDQIACKD